MVFCQLLQPCSPLKPLDVINILLLVCVCVLSHGRLFCNPMDCSLPDASVHGIFQARILEWGTISSSRDLPNPGIKPTSLASPRMTDRFFTTVPPGKPLIYCILSLSQTCSNVKIPYIIRVFFSCYETNIKGKASPSLFSTQFHIYLMYNHINSHNYGSFAKSNNLGIYIGSCITIILKRMFPTRYLSESIKMIISEFLTKP